MRRRLTRRRWLGWTGALAALLVVALAAGLTSGPAPGAGPLRLARELAALARAHGWGEALARARQGELSPEGQIVLHHRAPRVLAGAIVGAALAGAGVAFQALLRNPLADPFLLGVSSGAALGAALAVLALGVAAPLWMPACSFAGALLVAALIFVLGRRSFGTAGATLLLLGVVVNAILSSWILLLAHLVPPSERLRILAWLTGSLGQVAVGPAGLGAAAAVTLGGGLVLQWLARDLNLLALGETVAGSLGVAVRAVRVALFFTGSLVTAVAVALSGLVGFVGLVVPHLLRLVCGPDHRLLVPASMLAGAALLVLADAAARSALAPEELPVGVVTALAGGPLFLWLLLHRQRVPLAEAQT